MTNRQDDPTDVPRPDAATVAVPPAAVQAPALRPPRWSGKKTAVVAALAITFASAGTVGAAAAMPAGTGAERGGMGHGHLGTPPGGMPGTGTPGGMGPGTGRSSGSQGASGASGASGGSSGSAAPGTGAQQGAAGSAAASGATGQDA